MTIDASARTYWSLHPHLRYLATTPVSLNGVSDEHNDGRYTSHDLLTYFNKETQDPVACMSSRLGGMIVDAWSIHFLAIFPYTYHILLNKLEEVVLNL